MPMPRTRVFPRGAPRYRAGPRAAPRVSSTYMPLPRAITGTTGPRMCPWKKAIMASAQQMVQASTRVVNRPASTSVAFTRVPISRVITGTGKGSTSRSC